MMATVVQSWLELGALGLIILCLGIAIWYIYKGGIKRSKAHAAEREAWYKHAAAERKAWHDRETIERKAWLDGLTEIQQGFLAELGKNTAILEGLREKVRSKRCHFNPTPREDETP